MEEVDLSRKRRDGLIEQFLGFVETVVDRLIGRMRLPKSMREEYISAGCVGLIEAAERYDETRCADFRGYAYLRIRGSIIDFIRGSCDVSGKAYRILRALEAANDVALEEIERKGDRSASSVESDTTKLAHTIEYLAKSALAYRLHGVGHQGEGEAEIEGTNPEEQLISRREGRRLRQIVGNLPDKERQVVEQHYFHGRRFVDIASGDVGLSKSWVSRIHARALAMIRKQYEAETADPEVAGGGS